MNNLVIIRVEKLLACNIIIWYGMEEPNNWMIQGQDWNSDLYCHNFAFYHILTQNSHEESQDGTKTIPITSKLRNDRQYDINIVRPELKEQAFKDNDHFNECTIAAKQS